MSTFAFTLFEIISDEHGWMVALCSLEINGAFGSLIEIGWAGGAPIFDFLWAGFLEGRRLE